MPALPPDGFASKLKAKHEVSQMSSIVSDVGGTNARFALYEGRAEDGGQCAGQRRRVGRGRKVGMARLADVRCKM